MNRPAFYAALRGTRNAVFGVSIRQTQVNGCNAILAEAERRGTPISHLAYMLATAFHETAATMQPVRETLAKSDDAAIAILDRAWQAGKLGSVTTPYWRKDTNGKSWLGRGLVQLTHRYNYVKFGLTDDPAKAMEMETAVRILFDGMEQGLFTDKRSSDYLNRPIPDYVNARRIINGTDKALLISGYAKAFEVALKTAAYDPRRPLQTPTPIAATPVKIERAPIADGGRLANFIASILSIIKA